MLHKTPFTNCFLTILSVIMCEMRKVHYLFGKCVVQHTVLENSTNTSLRLVKTAPSRCLFYPLRPPYNHFVFVPFQTHGRNDKVSVIAGGRQ